MRHFLINPDGDEVEVSRYILRGADTITELAFDLESAAIPSDLNILLDNVSGAFDPGRGLFSQGELTEFILVVSGESRDQVLFVGTVTNVMLTETTTVEVVTRSVIASLMQCGFNMATAWSGDPVVTKTPARLVADLLGPSGLHLPGLFLDEATFALAEAAEENLGIQMRLSIPTGENVTFSDFLQELNRVTSAYVYSYNGYIRYSRVGGFDRSGYDYTFSGEVLANSVKAERPVLWQKTRVTALYWDGSANQKIIKSMDDYFDVEGETIMERFREKPIESDGLGGYLVHASLSSAETALQDVLGWRGRPRWQFEFEVDAIGSDVRTKSQTVPLLARARLIYSGGCAQMAIVEKTVSDQKATFRGFALAEPTFIHPGKRVFVHTKQVGAGNLQFYNNTGHEVKIYYRFDSETDYSSTTLADEAIFTLLNPGFETVYWYQAEGMPCGELPSRERTFTPEPVTSFILGTSVLGDELG